MCLLVCAQHVDVYCMFLVFILTLHMKAMIRIKSDKAKTIMLILHTSKVCIEDETCTKFNTVLHTWLVSTMTHFGDKFALEMCVITTRKCLTGCCSHCS